MKNVFVAVVIFFLTLVAWGKNDESDRSLPSIPSTVTEWTLVGEVPKISTRRQVSLASAPPVVSIPNNLAIGSREILRAWIVGKNNMQANFWFEYGFTNTAGKYSLLKVGKWSDGYDSYEYFLSDLQQGIDVLSQKFLLVTNYLAGSRVTASITVTYFNSSGVFTPFGLVLNRKQGNRESLNTKTISDSFRTFEANDFEQLIVPVPALHQLEIVITDKVGQIGTMTWTEASGAQLASWPKPQAEQVTTLYFGMKGWLCDASYKTRIKLTPKQGESETYTQYGDRLSLPTVVGMSPRREFRIASAPKGADIDIWSSPNMTEWKLRGTVENIVSPVSIPTLPSDGPMQFYRATAR